MVGTYTGMVWVVRNDSWPLERPSYFIDKGKADEFVDREWHLDCQYYVCSEPVYVEGMGRDYIL